MEPTIPLSEEVAEETAKQLIAAAYQPTSYRDHTPVPTVGTAPPVAQPGRPPMSQKATDISRMMIAGGVATVPPGLIAIGILVASRHADPTIIGMICAAPAALAVPILAIARLIRRAGEAAPPEIHNHYDGATVYQDQRHLHTRTSGVWAKTTNTQ